MDGSFVMRNKSFQKILKELFLNLLNFYENTGVP